MTGRMRVVLLISIVLALVGAGAAACGGSNGDFSREELRDYLREVRRLVNRIDERTEERTVQEAGEAFTLWAIVLVNTAGQLSGLTPPDDLAKAHEQLHTAMYDGGQAVGALREQHPEVDTLEEAQRVLSESRAVARANLRARAACREIEQYAKNHGEEVDLELC